MFFLCVMWFLFGIFVGLVVADKVEFTA